VNLNRLRCVVVGSTTLPARCAQILQEQGHTVSILATDDPETVRASADAGVATIVPLGELGEAVRSGPVDYLLSINNLSLIDEDVLAAPLRGAINFHDGPLPAYAGLSAPSWGILNGARRWGITWHFMTRLVDGGPILLDEPVDITSADTALTLNMKCFEAALLSFPRLVAALAERRLEPRHQNLAERSYFGRDQRPPAGGVLLWSQLAEQLSALVRALDFGIFPNRLGTAKLLLDGDALAVGELELLRTRSSEHSGTVLSVDDDSITVSTGSADVRLRALRTLEGDAVRADELRARLETWRGKQLPEPTGETLHRLTEVTSGLGRGEDFWASKLAASPALEVPRLTSAKPRSQVSRVDEAPLASLGGTGSRPDSIVAALVVFLARLVGQADIAVAYREWPPEPPPIGPLLTRSVPLRCQIAAERSFADGHAAALRELDDIRAYGPFFRDLFSRRPELHEARDFAAVVICRSTARPSPADAGSRLTVLVADDGSSVEWISDTVAGLSQQFETFLAAAAADPQQAVSSLPLLSEEELRRVLVEWNDTAADYPRDACLHELVEQQAARTPERLAVVADGEQITYAELCRRADSVARHLARRGVKPGERVGVCLERSVELVVCLLAILKAGGAYVPLDPAYPAERIRFMIDDARPVAVMSRQAIATDLLADVEDVLLLDEESGFSGPSPGPPGTRPTADDPAYVIYTSGSTGKPKGVVVSHRNVVNFVYGMDACIEDDEPGTFLAVTSISFDISVLELFWTLSRGFEVVLYTGADRTPVPARSSTGRQLDLSLFFFASRERDGAADRYRLLIEAAKFADSHGFSAVWTPERHFHAFGGLFPNPSVTSAAIAAMTKNLKIRAGSVVSPLHNPVRIAEEWAFVDNLSGGRVGISFASGWQPDDFVLAPENFADRKQLMFRQIDLVQRLWRGEAVPQPGPMGKDVEIQILPRPIQAELPVWVTAAGSPETFRMAGEHGFGLLTHLLGQSVSDLGQKLEIYRDARRARNGGGDSGEGNVVVMLHTFVGSDNDRVREQVREPMKAYLRSSVDLIQRAAWTFPTFKQATTTDEGKFTLDNLTDKELDEVLDFSFERYFETSGLLGAPEKCIAMVEELRNIGVDEIACLIDFHSDTDLVLEHLPNLDEVRRRSSGGTRMLEAESIPALIERYGVTHMQCTPSHAYILVQSAEGRRALGRLRQLLVGGEAFPPALAEELRGLVAGDVHNMYGPTETTIWSSMHRVRDANGTVPIGRPIANTQLYILDEKLRPVPAGSPGELFIGGDGVTIGYLGRPELTAERFLPDPFSHRVASRMYRTGDLARYLPDGNVEFLGRCDHQVKVRGHRVELGEIEAALGRHQDVGEAAVIAAGGLEDLADQRLVAYVTGRNGIAPAPEALRWHLQRQLPEFMIPSRFELLPAMPRTANGKIDRNALPSSRSGPPVEHAETVPARDETERALVTIWENALGVAPIGIDEDFFDLGGHSLLAMRVFAQIRRELDVELPLTDFLRAPTIRQLANLIARHHAPERPVASNGAQTHLPPRAQPALAPAESTWRGGTNRALQELAKTLPGAQTLRVRLHRARGVNIGENVWIGYGVVLETAHPEYITIEDNVSLSLRVTVIAHFMETAGVTIEHDAFLGPGVIVLPSVVIGHGAVISAGSVVSQSIPPMTVAQGNPAVPVARISTPLRPNSGTLESFSSGLRPLT
jgi:natural product biosynthesis luciferase-like monooxygenase protein